MNGIVQYWQFGLSPAAMHHDKQQADCDTLKQHRLSGGPPCPPSLLLFLCSFFLRDAGSLPPRHSVYLLWLLSLWCGPRVPFKSVFNLEWKGGRQIESRERLTDGGEGTDRAGLPLFNMKYKENRTQGCPQVRNYFLTGNSTVYWNFFINISFLFLFKASWAASLTLLLQFFSWIISHVFNSSLKHHICLFKAVTSHSTRTGKSSPQSDPIQLQHTNSLQLRWELVCNISTFFKPSLWVLYPHTEH